MGDGIASDGESCCSRRRNSGRLCDQIHDGVLMPVIGSALSTLFARPPRHRQFAFCNQIARWP